MLTGQRLAALLVALAALKVGLALGATVATLAATQALPTQTADFMLALVITFAAVAALLLGAGHRDRRARTLGVAYLLVASTFADSIARPHLTGSPLASTVAVIFALQPDAFIAFFLWRFASVFPRAPARARSDRTARIAVRATLLTGGVLFAGSFIWWLALRGVLPDRSAQPFMPLAREPSNSIFFPLQFVLAAGALLHLIQRARRAAPDERRRVSILVAGIVLGTTPTLAWVLVWSVYPPLERVLPVSRIGWLLYGTLLCVPLATAYAVLVRRALDVRLIVRQAIRYALARYSAVTLALLPLVALVVLLVRERREPLATVVLRPGALLLVGLTVAGVLLLRGRTGLLVRIDRRFFRDQYDTQHILQRLVEQCRWAGTREELASVLRQEIHRALHPEVCGLLLLDDGQFVSPDDRLPSLPADAAILAPLRGGRDTADISFERLLPAADDEPPRWATAEHGTDATVTVRASIAADAWLSTARVQRMLPLRDDDGQLVGLVALGPKRSELPYSAEDRALLQAVASAAELAVGRFGLLARTGAAGAPADGAASSGADQREANECAFCGKVQAATGACGRCGHETEQALLPLTLRGVFETHERIGAGGMGVVYRGTDLRLERSVALKTLPYLSPAEARRLQREARTMALVSHPNLAVIHGIEEWRGRPVLVCEYLAGGTLADRLHQGPMPVDDAIDLALVLLQALATLHEARLLHRDIKPSNIGFAHDGTPKLLDFGLAHRLDGDEPGPAERVDTLTLLRGTPFYMPPESLGGEAVGPSADLWSLGVVLHEAITGRIPIPGRAFDVPAACAPFFRRTLALDPAERPPTAWALARELRALRATLRATEQGVTEDVAVR